MKPLFDHRLVVVSGKGGVGKTVVTAALALAAAQTGRRVCVAELFGNARIQAMFGRPRAYGPEPLTDGVDAISLTPMEAVDDFGHRKLKMDALVRVMLANRVSQAFIEAVPGLHDLVQLGKIENMLLEPLPGENHYDLVVLDAPSTGHGLTLLGAARAMSEMTRVGPFHDLAHLIEKLLEDPDLTALAAVTLPEELPVHETIQLVTALGDERPLLQLVVANQVRPPPFPAGMSWSAARAALLTHPDPDLRELASMAEGLVDRDLHQTEALALLDRGVSEAAGRPVPVLRLPRVEPHEVGIADVRMLGKLLHDAIVGVTP